MPDVCYDCGCELNSSNRTKEHVPAQNLYDGFGDEFKNQRITVPACSTCNGKYSKIDHEIRDLVAVKSDNTDELKELTSKGVRSIFRKKSWKERVHTDLNGSAKSVSFDYNQLCELHVKNFKALFYRKYGFPLPKEYKISIGTEGDELDSKKLEAIQSMHDYIRTDKEWEVFGNAEIFKYILKDITFEEGKGYYESGDFEKLIAVGGVLVYHDQVVAVVIAGKKDFL